MKSKKDEFIVLHINGCGFSTATSADADCPNLMYNYFLLIKKKPISVFQTFFDFIFEFDSTFFPVIFKKTSAFCYLCN